MITKGTVMLLVAVALSGLVPTSASKLKKVSNAIPNSYIVVLDDKLLTKPVSEAAQEFAAAHNAKIHSLYEYAIKGFAANMDEAAAIGGTTYGVAKNVNLIAVRGLDCSGNGSDSTVIAGVNWVTNNCYTYSNAVANMSLGGPKSDSLDSAVGNSQWNCWLTYVAAAGNNNIDASNVSPAAGAWYAVGASDQTDARASFSNYGSIA